MTFSYTEVVASLPTLDTYGYSFPHLDDTHIKVSVNGTVLDPGDYTVNSGVPNVVITTNIPIVDDVVRVFRESSPSVRLVDFESGSALTETNLDLSADQLFYMLQESIDDTEDRIAEIAALGTDDIENDHPSLTSTTFPELTGVLENIRLNLVTALAVFGGPGADGRVPDSVTSDQTRFLRDDGVWAIPAGGGGGGGGGVWGAITGTLTNQADLVAALAGKADTSHTHPQSEITDLVSDLAGKAAVGHTHPVFNGTNDGLVPDPVTAPAGEFLKDDGTWDTPAGGGGAPATPDSIVNVSGADDAPIGSALIKDTDVGDGTWAAQPAAPTNLTLPLAEKEVLIADGSGDLVDRALVTGDVTGLDTALAGKSATGHGHAIGDVTNLQTELDGKSATGHGHDELDTVTTGTVLGRSTGGAPGPVEEIDGPTLKTMLAHTLGELDGVPPGADTPAVGITLVGNGASWDLAAGMPLDDTGREDFDLLAYRTDGSANEYQAIEIDVADTSLERVRGWETEPLSTPNTSRIAFQVKALGIATGHLQDNAVTPAKMSHGTSLQLMRMNVGGTAPEWGTPVLDNISDCDVGTTTAKGRGQMLVVNSGGTVDNVPLGTNGFVPVANATLGAGLEWGDPLDFVKVYASATGGTVAGDADQTLGAGLDGVDLNQKLYGSADITDADGIPAGTTTVNTLKFAKAGRYKMTFSPTALTLPTTTTDYDVDGLHAIGATTIALKTGTSTIKPGMQVKFGTDTRAYIVVSADAETSTTSITIDQGLDQSAADNATVTGKLYDTGNMGIAPRFYDDSAGTGDPLVAGNWSLPTGTVTTFITFQLRGIQEYKQLFNEIEFDADVDDQIAFVYAGGTFGNSKFEKSREMWRIERIGA